MSEQVTKAKVTQVPLGSISVEGLMLPDGTFGIAVPQIAKLFSDSINQFHASRDIKSLLGKDFQLTKIKSDLHPKAVNYLSLKEFNMLLPLLVAKGSKAALSFMVDLAGLSLEQLWSDAFGVKFEKEDRQQYLKQRMRGKVARRTLTDAIKDYIESHPELSDNYKRFIWSLCSDHLNKIILGAKAKQAKEFYQVPKHSLLRNHIPEEALRELELTEELAARLIDEKDMEPLEAVKQASAQMFTKFIGLS